MPSNFFHLHVDLFDQLNCLFAQNIYTDDHHEITSLMIRGLTIVICSALTTQHSPSVGMCSLSVTVSRLTASTSSTTFFSGSGPRKPCRLGILVIITNFIS